MKRNNLRYYFKEESVTLEVVRPAGGSIGNTYISFNCYNLQSRKKFKDFKEELQNSGRRQYGTLNEIYGLASKHNVRGVYGYKPTITDKIAF